MIVDIRRLLVQVAERWCPGADDCGWLFYDTSRNGTRRWRAAVAG